MMLSEFYISDCEPRGWEVSPGEGVENKMGSFSDLGSSLGVLVSLEAGPLSPSKAGIWLWLQELPHVISQAELRLCVISFH